MEALLPEEALDDDFKSFDMAVRVLTLKDYDYLDFRNEAFDKVKFYKNDGLFLNFAVLQYRKMIKI